MQGCIEWLRAYIDFAKHHGLGSKNGKLNLELRDETDAYYPGQIYHTPATKKVDPDLALQLQSVCREKNLKGRTDPFCLSRRMR